MNRCLLGEPRQCHPQALEIGTRLVRRAAWNQLPAEQINSRKKEPHSFDDFKVAPLHIVFKCSVQEFSQNTRENCDR